MCWKYEEICKCTVSTTKIERCQIYSMRCGPEQESCGNFWDKPATKVDKCEACIVLTEEEERIKKIKDPVVRRYFEMKLLEKQEGNKKE